MKLKQPLKCAWSGAIIKSLKYSSYYYCDNNKHKPLIFSPSAFISKCPVCEEKLGFHDMSKELQGKEDNYRLMLRAVCEDVTNFHYASNRLKNNRKIVLEAVRQKGYMLEYASDDLKKNKEIVLTAIISNPESIKFALE